MNEYTQEEIDKFTERLNTEIPVTIEVSLARLDNLKVQHFKMLEEAAAKEIGAEKKPATKALESYRNYSEDELNTALIQLELYNYRNIKLEKYLRDTRLFYARWYSFLKKKVVRKYEDISFLLSPARQKQAADFENWLQNR